MARAHRTQLSVIGALALAGLGLAVLLSHPQPSSADHGGPTVEAVEVASAPAGGTYAIGETVEVTLTFSEAVTVDTVGGRPRLQIDMDPADWGEKWAGYSSGSGTAELRFNHEVEEPNYSTQGVAVLADSLELNGGAIRSADGVDAHLSHAGLDHDPAHRVDWRPPPQVTSVVVSSDAEGDHTYVLGDVITVRVTFDKAVLVSGAPQLTIDMDPADWGEKPAIYAGGSGSSELSFSHTVVEPNYSAQGIAVNANSLELSGGTIRSEAGAHALLSHAGLDHDATHMVDWGLVYASREPVVNRQTQNYAWFVEHNNAPRGVLVSKEFYGIFSDPDGDPLTYAVTIPAEYAGLVELLHIREDGSSDVLAAQSDLSLEVIQRVWFRADAEDWHTLTANLPNPLTITATLTATDPDGLSRSLDGEFRVAWEQLAGPPDAPESLEVLATPGSLDLLATWDETDGASSYKLRWRQVGTEFQAADAVTVDDPITAFAVSGYGQWEVLLQACNDLGCGPEAARTADVVQAASLRLERATDEGDNPQPRTITASWDAVDGATSYTLRWQRDGSDAPAPSQSGPTGQARGLGVIGQTRAVSAQTGNQITVPGDRTSAEFTVPDGGAYQAELQAAGAGDEVIALGSSILNQAAGQPDTSPPRLLWGEVDGDRMTIHFSEPLDETATGGFFWTHVYLAERSRVSVKPGITEIDGDKVIVKFSDGLRARDGMYVLTSYFAQPGDSTRLQDPSGNQVQTLWWNLGGARSTRRIFLRNLTGPPRVTRVSIASDSGADRSYLAGETIKVQLELSEEADVTGTPRVKLDLDPAAGGERWADYTGGSGTQTLEFAYTVVTGDSSTAGVAVLQDTLELNGGTILSVSALTEEHANLDHSGTRHDPGHRVGEFEPSTAEPTLFRAVADGTTLTLTFNQALAAAASLANDAFTVKKTPQGGVEQTVALSGVPSISGDAVVLTLASAVLDTDIGVKVSYAKPTSGASNRVVDPDGNEAESFSDVPVINAADTTQPRLVRGEVNGDVMTLYFSEPLDEASAGASDYFRVTLQFRAVNSYLSFTAKPRQMRVEGDTVVLVGLGRDVHRARVDRSVTVYYFAIAQHDRLTDVSGNQVHTPGEQSPSRWRSGDITLDNLTQLPSPQSVTAVGSRVLLSFDAPMDEGSIPPASAFTVEAGGSAVRLSSHNPVIISGRTVTLRLVSDVPSGETVTVSYAKPSSGRLRNVVHEEAPDFTQAHGPEATTVTAVRISSDPGSDDTYGAGDEIRVTVTFSEAVDVSGSPRLQIDMDPADWGEKWATYTEGSGTTELKFVHTVVEPNYSARGIAVLANSLQLNGGTIQSAAFVNAVLFHAGLAHDSGHQVDWQN